MRIWIKDTLRWRYATLPQIKLRLKKKPIGTIAFMYNCEFIGTFLRESRRVVNRARSWVMIVAKARWKVVRKMAVSGRSEL